MDNLETSLASTVEKARGNASGDIVASFIKSRASTILIHPEYYMDVPGPSIALSGPHNEFFRSDFGTWIGIKHVLYGICRPFSIHKVWRALGLSKHIVEHLPSLQQEVTMKRYRVMPVKKFMVELMLALKEDSIKEDAILVHMH